jgi:hypothetical protein
MVRRDEAVGRVIRSRVSRCSSPAGVSPASVSAGAPGSRPQVSRENAAARAGCQKPLRRKPARGPQPNVKPAASTDLPSESRAGHVAAKATSAVPRSGGTRTVGLGGVWGAARVHRDERNTRGPSAPPWSRHSASYKPTAKSSRAQRESEGVVVLLTTVQKNAVRGKGPCFGRAWQPGTCEDMAGRTGPNHPGALLRVVNDAVIGVAKTRQLCPTLASSAKRQQRQPVWLRRDTRSASRMCCPRSAHASTRRPSVSRVREIRMHGLKGGPALSPMTTID